MKYISAFLLLTLISISGYSQSKITFNVNLKPQLEDSTFVPPNDFIEITGDLYPLGKNKRLRLRDSAPKDSIYTVEIRFPRRLNNQQLTYTYIMTTAKNGEEREMRPRSIVLRKRYRIRPLFV